MTGPDRWSTTAPGLTGGWAPGAADTVGREDAAARSPTVTSESQAGNATRALQALQRAVDQFTDLPTHGAQASLHHQAMAALHGLLACAGAAAGAGVPSPDLYAATAAARELCARHSRTLAHAQQWPRGYPGDFELIERLLNADPGAEGGTLDRALEACVLQLPIVWQHRVKVAWQARLVRRRLNGTGVVRVLSIGCGGARDLLLLEPYELGRLEVVLNDLDPDALALAGARLSRAVRRITGIRGNALRSTTKMRAAGPFDVIVVGGLLDYLPERAARTLLQHAGEMLKPGGLLGATNIAAANPWRHMLQLLTNWTLIERTHEEMSSLLRAPNLKVSIALDDSGLTWLAVASKPDMPDVSQTPDVDVGAGRGWAYEVERRELDLEDPNPDGCASS
jgi:extracellular factor (EF) 3-hydroxypalmitic acid methyl ester biosynthesis protein